MLKRRAVPGRCPACHLGTWQVDRRAVRVELGDRAYWVQAVPGHACETCLEWRPDPVWGTGTRRGGRTWSAAWSAHAEAFRRSHPRCDWPGCRSGTTDAHHVQYRSRGGSDDWSNLRPLCKPHHEEVHRLGGRDDD